MHSIHLARKQNLGLKTCDGQQELLNFLRSDIIEVATRLQKGGLGYLDDTTELEEKVRSKTLFLCVHKHQSVTLLLVLLDTNT